MYIYGIEALRLLRRVSGIVIALLPVGMALWMRGKAAPAPEVDAEQPVAGRLRLRHPSEDIGVLGVTTRRGRGLVVTVVVARIAELLDHERFPQ